jgi:hypothetical protein
MRISDINRRLEKAGHPVTLYKGDGYLYLVFDNGKHWEDESIHVCYYNQMPGQWWLAEALGFAARCAAKIKEG